MENNNEPLYSIGAFAKLTAVTERTLRYYDRKGLLKPSIRNSQGHRFYTEKDLIGLQKILTLKYLDYSLDQISDYLQQPEDDFQQSLAKQYEMLRQKQQHLKNVLETIGRMQNIVEGAGKVDSDLLLLFIHNIQHEEKQKQWLLDKIPSSIIDAMFMEGLPAENRLQMERQMTAMIIQLKDHYKQGKHPLDEDVLACGRELVIFLEALIGPTISALSEDELAQIESLNDPEAAMDPILFPTAFTKDEDAFMVQVFDHLEALKTLKEGISDE